MVAKLLTKAEETVRARAMIFKVVLQTVLLYGEERWVVMEATLKVMEGLHNRVDRKIPGMSYWRVRE